MEKRFSTGFLTGAPGALAASAAHANLSAMATRVCRGGDDAMKKGLACAIAVAGFGLMAGSVSVFGVRAPSDPTTRSAFTEETWPFLLDEWGVGKAFVCAPAQCGVKVEVFVRPKIGFCNCSTGVSDDRELERVADTALVTGNALPLGPSRPIKVGWMTGLSRPYQAGESGVKEPGAKMISFAFNSACDVVVAVATLGTGDPAAVEPAVLAFLRSDPMVQWARRQLGPESARGEN
jgi:hypothetical protein